MNWKLAATLILAAALTVACNAGAASDAPAATPTTGEPATEPLDSGDATEPAVSLGTPDFGLTPEGTSYPNPVLVAQQVLAQQVSVPPDEIVVVKHEQVEWDTSCLGLPLEAELCEDGAVPGYRITLEANGEQYVIHTDDTGQRVALAAAPEVAVENPAVTWRSPEAPCQEATLGSDAVIYGLCDGPMLKDPYAPQANGTTPRVDQLEAFVAAYESFDAENPAGRISFTGQGDTPPTAAEQRMITEWARLTAIEASTGSPSIQLGLAQVLHQEGGIAGVCYEELVYATGTVRLFSCAGEQLEEVGQTTLSAGELEQFYGWLDELGTFNLEQTDDAVADALLTQMVFGGRGEEEASEEQQQEILQFALDQVSDIGLPETGPEGESATPDATDQP